MIRRLAIALLPTIALLTSSCEHKELCYTHPHYSNIRVVFDWSNISEQDMPKGMRVVFFGMNSDTEAWTFDFPSGKDGVIELPEDDYQVICYNYDSYGITWDGIDNYPTYKAVSTTTVAPDGSEARTTPSLMVGDYISFIDLKDIAEDTERTVDLTPQKLVCRYSYEVHGISGLDKIKEFGVGLSGMADALYIADDHLPENGSATLVSEANVADSVVVGHFYTFGYMPQQIGNEFRIYMRSRSGKRYVDSHDVTEQIRRVPVIGHLADVHIVINSNFTVPTDTTDTGGGSGDNHDSMFDVGVDNWQDINTDIKI